MATNTDEREEIKPVAPTEQTKWRDPSLVGKYMVDPKTGLAGLFRSPDNGETWVLTDTVYGHVYNQDEVDNIWDNGAGHKVADEVKSATADLPNVRKQADEAVKFAESAVAASKVNSDAIVAQSEAISEAKSAMDSATAEIQQTAANAASDAAKIRADVARVQNEVDTAKSANSASVEALKSDINTAKQDLADGHDSLTKAQSAVEQNQKLINDSVAKITSDVSATKQDLATVHDSLTKAQATAEQNQKAINDSIAEINANVDATNQDLAGVRKDLTKAQSDITANQKAIDDNVAQISDDITQDRKDIADVRQGLTKAQSDITANQKAVNDNVAQINSNIEQDRKDIASAQQANADTAKQLDTYSKQATEQGKTIKTIQDKQDGFTATLADVQGNVSQVSDKVDGLSASLKDTQGNVASVKAQADQLSATLTNHGKSIATLTASAKELSSTLEDADGRLSKVEQTAQTNSSTLSDVQGDLSQVKQNATKLVSTLKDAQGNISTLQQKSDSLSTRLASAQGDIATLQTGIDGVKAILTSHDKSIHTLQADSKSLHDNMKDAQGNISSLQKTATSLDSEFKDHDGRISKVEQTASTLTNEFSDEQGHLNRVEQTAQGTQQTVANQQGQINTIKTDAAGIHETLTGQGNQIASLNVTLNGLNTKYEGVERSGNELKDRLDNLKVGTSNLLHHSDTFEGWHKGASVSVSSNKYLNGNIAVLKNTGSGGTALDAELDGPYDNQPVTWTVYAKADNAGDKLHTELWGGGGHDDQPLTTEWQVYKFTGQRDARDHSLYLWGCQGNKGNIYVALPFAVVGNTIGTWSPNTDDVADKITTNSTQIDQNKKAITLKADQSTVNNLSGEVSEKTAQLKVQADSLSATVTDQGKNISSLQATAKELSSTLEDADGRLNKVEQTAQTNSSTLSDVQGNLSQVKQQADGLVSTLKDAQGNISTLQQKADSLSTQLASAQGDIATLQTGVDSVKATLTSHDKSIHTLQADSKSLKDSMVNAQGDISTLRKTATDVTSELEDHTGRLSKVEQSAAKQAITLSDLQGNLTQVKQTADNLVTTLKDAQGNIDQIKQDAKGTLEQLSNAQGDITALQKDVSGIKLTIADHDKNIHTLQVDSKTLKDDMADAKGNISSLQKTSTSLVSEFRDHDGRLSKVEQNATEHTSELADAKGNIDKVTQKANALQLLLSDAQKNIQNIQLDAKGLHDTLNGQSNQLASLNVTLNNLDSKYSGITGDLQSKQTALSTEQQQTKDMLLRKVDKSEVDNVKGTVNQVSAEQKTMADQINQKVSSAEYQTLKDKVNGMKIGGRNLLIGTSTDEKSGKSYHFAAYQISGGLKPNTTYTLSGWARVDQKAIDNNQNVFVCAYSDDWQWSIWLNITKSLTSQYGKVTFTTPSGKELWNNVTVYLSHPNGDSSQDSSSGQGFISKLKLEEGNVATDWTPAPEDTITAIQKNTTAINENSKLISLMAKQTEVDNVKNTAQQISSRLDILAGEVKSKVDETRVNSIVDGKGYAMTSTVQSLVDQKAGTINESITNLDAKYSAKDGVNLATKTGNVNASGGYGTIGNIGGISLDTINDLRGKHITISVDVEWKGWKSGNQKRIGYELQINYDDGSVEYDGSWLTPTTTDGKQRITATYKLKDQHIKSLGEGHAYIQINCTSAKVSHLKIERGTVATPWTPAPSDNATVTQLQSVTASIDGLQSNVTNFKNDTSSQITQLSNVIQSKVSASDFNDLKDKTTWKSTDNIDLNSAVSQQKIFVKGGSNLPPGGYYWWYVQVEPGYDSRIVQYAVSDRDNIHYSRQYDGSKWSAWSQGATESEITQLRDDINLRVKSGDLLSQINLTAHNTLIQSNKIYLDSSSTVFSGKAFIPSAAIVSLDADKINTGTLNTQMVSIGDDQTRLWARSNYLYLTGKDQGDAYNMRIGGDKIEFVTTEIPNDAPYMDGITPMYQIAYDGDTKSRLKIRSFNRLTGSNEFPIEMYDSVNISKDEIDLAANNQMKLSIRDDGVHVRRSLFFENGGGTGVFGGFTRADNSNIVEFSTGDNNGENFRIDCGARFMQYVYINGNARAQSWLTNSTLSKKTNIRKLDQQIALDKIRQDDQYLYEYKRNIEQGIYDPQASFIIDDVNDVSHYSVPREFIDQTGKYREPNVELAYLIAAFQAIDKQVQKQKEEIKELKEKLQHE